MVFADASRWMAGLDRPPAYHRCLLYLLATLDPLEWRHVTAADVAEGAGMSRQSAERGLVLLEADRVILGKGKAAAKARRLSNRVAWASTAQLYHSTPRDPELEDARGR